MAENYSHPHPNHAAEGSPESKRSRHAEVNSTVSESITPSPARSNAAWALASLFEVGANTSINSSHASVAGNGPFFIAGEEHVPSGSSNRKHPPAPSMASRPTFTNKHPGGNAKLSRCNSVKLARYNSLESPQLNLNSSTSQPAESLSRKGSLEAGQALSRNNSMEYSRREKSLANLCTNFMQLYGKCPVSSTVISIDHAASSLGVERRRIYDIVNILEPLSLVIRLKKNTYLWQGCRDVFNNLRQLQLGAIATWPEDARAAGMMVNCDKEGEMSTLQRRRTSKQQQQQQQLSRPHSTSPPPPSTSMNAGMRSLSPLSSSGDHSTTSNEPAKKTLAEMCVRFVHLFLVGHKVVSLGMAHERSLLEGITPPSDPVKSQKTRVCAHAFPHIFQIFLQHALPS
jgi:hypothetical protein